ncbi:unnamed protein product [Prunus armeniaca]
MKFDTYEERNGSKISLGDKTSCDVLGVGIVKIKIHDGVVRSLSKVRHVQELRRNLIFLGTLDREGYSYQAKERKLLVTQGKAENSTKEVLYTKEKRVRDLIVKELVQRNEATSMLKTNWARKKDKVHKGEVKTRDDGENVVGLVTTEKMLLIKVIMEGTPRPVELDIRVEEGRYQQQTHKGVLLEVEPSSQVRSKPKEFIKLSPGSG